jgi:glycosyltransferase involved in cell wall biosynthesis
VRLLVMTQFFWPETFRVNDLVAELIARGHDVTILTGLPNYPDGRVFEKYRLDPRSFASFRGAEVLRVPVVPRGRNPVSLALNYLSYVASAGLLGAWKLRGREFDAIFVSMSSPITAVLPAILQRRLKRAPLLVWILDLWPETLSAVGVVRSPALLGWVGRLVAFIYRRTDHILVQSKAFLPNIRRYAGEDARVDYFPAWAEPVFANDPSSVEVAPELAPYRDTFNVLFAGNIGEAQDFPSILDAAEALDDRPDVRWLILGDGRAAEWVRHEISRRRLGDRVIMLGRHPIERMPAFFRGADALLVTLRRDPIFALTIPGKVQSYLAAGIPLLGMLDGEGARVIDESGAGLACAAGEGRALAGLVRRLQDMTAMERAAMSARGSAYCRREFDRATLVTAFERWIGQVSDVENGAGIGVRA